MIPGLDGPPPSEATLQAAQAAGVRVWGGYIATRPNVGLAFPYTSAEIALCRRHMPVVIGFCSGEDDPSGVKALAAQLGVLAGLDVEPGIRPDGAWVQPWLDASGAGLYGNLSVHAGRHAAFHVLAAYPGFNPGTTWTTATRPAGICAWQWQGTHDAFGQSVDSSWWDDGILNLMGGTDMLTGSEKRAWARIGYAIIRPTAEPSETELEACAATILDDGSNVDAVLAGMRDSAEGAAEEGREKALAQLLVDVPALSAKLAAITAPVTVQQVVGEIVAALQAVH